MKIILISSLFFICRQTSAQNSTNNASGGDATGTGGSSSYSVGQIDYIEATGTGGSSGQGIQQPYEIYEVEVEDGIQDKLNVSIYPNPTTDMIVIDMGEETGYSYSLTDVKGSSLSTTLITTGKESVSMSDKQEGVYILNLFKNDKSYSYRIIKH